MQIAHRRRFIVLKGFEYFDHMGSQRPLFDAREVIVLADCPAPRTGCAPK
jgi:hypothetical protein